MENKETNNQQAQARQLGEFIDAKFVRKGDYVLIFLPNNTIVRKHINFYLSMLGVPFTPVAQSKPSASQTKTQVA